MGLFDTSTTSSSTISNPLAEIQVPKLSGIYSTATDLYNQGSPGYYPGSTVAAYDPVRAQGANLGVDAALGAQTSLANNQTGLLNNILSGNDPYTNQLAQQAAAGVASSFGQAGSLGSARNYQQGNLAASDAILSRQLDASQQVNQAQQNALAPSNTLRNIGTDFQTQNQNIIDADKERYDYQANQPWDLLNKYQDVIVNPNASGYSLGTTESTSTDGGLGSDISGIAGIISTIAGIPAIFNQGGMVSRSHNGMLAQGGMAPRRHTNYGMLAEGGDVANRTNPFATSQPTQTNFDNDYVDPKAYASLIASANSNTNNTPTSTSYNFPTSTSSSAYTLSAPTPSSSSSVPWTNEDEARLRAAVERKTFALQDTSNDVSFGQTTGSATQSNNPFSPDYVTPVVDTPVTTTPIVDTPATTTPVVDTPVVETPVVETPVNPSPGVNIVSPGAYAPVDTISTQYDNSNWTRPSPGHGWAIIDGRYQLVPTSQGIQPGGGTIGGGTSSGGSSGGYGGGYGGYVPTPIGGGGSGSNGFTGYVGKTDAAGNPAPYLGFDIYDWDGNDSFLTNKEIGELSNVVSGVIGREYDPKTTILTEDERKLVNDSVDARIAQEDIYNNNQVIYGTPTGNNLTSATTGNITGSSVWSKIKTATTGDKSYVIDSQGQNLANDAGSTLNNDGTYDISSWYPGVDDIVLTPAGGGNSSSGSSGGSSSGGGSSSSGSSNSGGFISGGGSDGVGNFGAVGDFFGGIGDAIGVTNYGGNSNSSSGSSGSSSSGGSSGGGYSCYVSTALTDLGLWHPMKRNKLAAWCMRTMPEGKLKTNIWRSGYMTWGKSILVPYAATPFVSWMAQGFYDSTVKKRKGFKATTGKLFFTVPSYVIGSVKWATGNLGNVQRKDISNG